MKNVQDAVNQWCDNPNWGAYYIIIEFIGSSKGHYSQGDLKMSTQPIALSLWRLVCTRKQFEAEVAKRRVQYLNGMYTQDKPKPVDFIRENRYTILKNTDIESALNDFDKIKLNIILYKVNEYRLSRNKPYFKCAIVEQDWPEYESTCAAIEKRCGEQS